MLPGILVTQHPYIWNTPSARVLGTGRLLQSGAGVKVCQDPMQPNSPMVAPSGQVAHRKGPCRPYRSEITPRISDDQKSTKAALTSWICHVCRKQHRGLQCVSWRSGLCTTETPPRQVHGTSVVCSACGLDYISASISAFKEQLWAWITRIASTCYLYILPIFSSCNYQKSRRLFIVRTFSSRLFSSTKSSWSCLLPPVEQRCTVMERRRVVQATCCPRHHLAGKRGHARCSLCAGNSW